MMFRIWHVARPVDDRCYEAEEIFLDLDLPFVPSQGTLLRLAPEGALLKVEHVYWDATEGQLIQLFTHDPDRLPTMQEMLGQGWKRAGGGRNTPPELGG